MGSVWESWVWEQKDSMVLSENDSEIGVTEKEQK